MIRRLRTAVTEYLAADRALAEVSIRDIEAGVFDETPEYDAANDRVLDAERAMPWTVYFFADWLSYRRNRDVFERLWEAEEQAEWDAVDAAAEREERES